MSFYGCFIPCSTYAYVGMYFFVLAHTCKYISTCIVSYFVLIDWAKKDLLFKGQILSLKNVMLRKMLSFTVIRLKVGNIRESCDGIILHSLNIL